VFSPADYELAARVTGLPVPKTAAEKAAAAPVVAQVLREYSRALPPMPGFEDEGVMNTSATRSLNRQPDVSQPEAKNQLERRLRAGVTDPDDVAEVMELADMLTNDPALVEMLLEILTTIQTQDDASGDFLSQQEPLEYDTPGYGGQYSVLNAPSSSQIPPSMRYQPLS
jgi:hypothetical protein